MQHRVEVDGLRAFAVLPVMFFHAGFGWISGGFIGVDIFFVISGFLITAIIQKELSQSRFTLVGFYERRARRILPAMFVTLLLCLPFAWWLMDVAQFYSFGKSLIAVVLFIANFFFGVEANYFAPSAELMPLLHMWSLAVEEQFYVVFPLLMIVLARIGVTGGGVSGGGTSGGSVTRGRLLVAILAGIALITFGVTVYMSTVSPVMNFYWPVGRAWELLAGAIAALLYRRAETKTALQEATAFLGITLVIGAMFLLTPELRLPSEYSLPAVVGTVLILVAADNRTIVGRFLSWRPFVEIGLISYSAYLLHQPVFAFARLYLGMEPPVIVAVALLGLTLVLARLSWQLVEEPVRHKQGRFYPSRNALFACSAVLIGAFGVTGWAFVKTDIAATRVSPDMVQALEMRKGVRRFVKDCQYAALSYDFKVPETLADHCFGPIPDTEIVDGQGGEHAAPFAMIIGDSFAGVMADQTMDMLASRGWRSARMTVPGCASFPGFRLDRDRLQCDRSFELLFKIIQQQKPDLLIVINRYNYLFNNTPFDNGEGGHEKHGPFGQYSHDPVGPDHRVAQRGAKIVDDGMAQLRSVVPHIALIYPIPEAGWNVPYLYARQVARGVYSGAISTSYDLYRARNGAAIGVLDRQISAQVIKVDPAPLFCGLPGHEDRCLNSLGDKVFYGDSNHLSDIGVAKVVDLLRAQLPAIRRPTD